MRANISRKYQISKYKREDIYHFLYDMILRGNHSKYKSDIIFEGESPCGFGGSCEELDCSIMGGEFEIPRAPGAPGAPGGSGPPPNSPDSEGSLTPPPQNMEELEIEGEFGLHLEPPAPSPPSRPSLLGIIPRWGCTGGVWPPPSNTEGRLIQNLCQDKGSLLFLFQTSALISPLYIGAFTDIGWYRDFKYLHDTNCGCFIVYANRVYISEFETDIVNNTGAGVSFGDRGDHFTFTLPRWTLSSNTLQKIIHLADDKEINLVEHIPNLAALRVKNLKIYGNVF